MATVGRRRRTLASHRWSAACRSTQGSFPDHLACAAHDHPTLEQNRRDIGGMSLAQRIAFVGETASSLPMLAIAAWYASGVEWGKERRIGLGDLRALMGAFRDLGVPSDVVTATHIAAMRTREPIVVMTPLIWLASEKADGHHVIYCPIPPVRMIGDLPAYALDKHTALSKGAIHRFARECPAVRNALAAHVPEYRAKRSNLRKVDEPVDLAKQVIVGDMPLKTEAVEQRLLHHAPLVHHRPNLMHPRRRNQRQAPRSSGVFQHRVMGGSSCT
jgi:hypothetical protein